MKSFKFLVTLIILTVVAPLWASREKSDMSADFGFTRDRKFTVWPLMVYHREKRGDKFKFDMLFSIYRYNRGFNRRFTHSHLFPFYFKNKNSNITDLRLFSAYYPSLFHYYKNRDKEVSSFKVMEFHPKVSLLDFTRSENGLFVKNNFLFLLWHENDVKRKKQHLIFFPFFWHFKDPQYSSHTLFPLFSTGKSPNESESHLNITPLFSHRESKSKKSNRLYPIWWQGEEIRRGDTIRYNHIMPFYWSRSGRGRKSNIFFPFFWKFEKKNYKSITFFPFVSRGKSENGYRSHLAITPLYKRRRRGKRRSQRLFPIWWQGSYGEGEKAYRYNHIAPIYWSVKSKDRDKRVFFPLIWSLKDRYYTSFTFFPFFSKGESSSGKRNHLAVTPLFHHRRSGVKRTTRLYPFWWRMSYSPTSGRKRSYNHLAPIFWSYRRGEKNYGFSLFPLIWGKRRGTYRSFRLFPILHKTSRGGRYSYDEFTLFPLFFHRSSDSYHRNTLFPIWYSGRKYSKKDSSLVRKYNHVLPVYWSSETPSSKKRVFFPFLWKFEDPHYSSFTLFPFMSHGESPDQKRSHLMVTPLFHNRKHGRGFNRVFFPLWWKGEYNGDKGYAERYNHIAPFFWSTRRGTHRNWAFAPFVWSLHDNYRDVLSFPPLFRYWKRKDSDNSLLSITPFYHHRVKHGLSSNRFYPIWFQGKRKCVTKRWDRDKREPVYLNDTITYNHIAPLFWSRKGRDFHSRVLFPLIWDLERPHYKSLTLFPFFSHGRSPDKTSGHLAVTPLFRHKYYAGLSRTHLFPFWFHGRKLENPYSEDAGDTVTYNHIMPLYWSKRGASTNNKVLFPLYWDFNNPQYRSKTLFPLFSIGSSPDKSGKHLSISPLFHHKKRVKSSGKKEKSTVLFPFYWNFERGKRKSTVFFPLIWELDKNMDADSAYSATTVPGLFSRGKSKDGSTSNLMLGSLFWHRENTLRQRTAFYPFFHYRNTFNVEKKFDLLFFLYRYKKAKSRTSHSLFWPLVASTRDIDYHTFRISPLFWYKKDLNSRFFLAPPLFFYRDDEYKKKFRFLWQFYAYNRVKGEKKQHSIFWKLWDLNKYDNGDREFRILHYLYTNKRVKGKVERGVFPFFRLKKDAEGNRSLGFLFNMFKSTKKKLPSCDDFYREQRIFWFIRIRSNYGSLDKECRKDVFQK